MKKLIIILSILICTANFAQDLSGVKILLYPQFNSSEGKNDNYVKAEYYKKLLGNLGAEVLLIDNSENNLPLSQMAAIADQNDVDFVNSIDNKNLINSEDENYSLVIYNSFENFDVEDAGKLILDGIANSNRIDNNYISAEGENEYAGNFFMGVNAPGIIIVDSKKGIPYEADLLKNQDYLKNEVWGYIRGIINFYETNPFKKGFIAGIVSDKKEKLDEKLTNGEEVLKPVNNIKVTLIPGGKTYVGDFNNNGFFYFDSLEPGEYKLIYEAGTYSTDSSVVTVASNQTTFADKLLEKDFSIPPSVFNYSPHDTTNKADTESDIKIVFSIPMDQESTEEAFSIEPDIDGEFEWSNEDHVLRFIPENAMDTSSRYEIFIDTTAKGKNNINLQSQSRFYFDTKNRFVEVTGNNVTKINDSLITTQRIEFSFSKSMDVDETEDAFEIEPEVNGHFEWSPDYKQMSFVPEEAYKTSTEYSITIDEDAETYNGLELGYDYKLEFITRSEHIYPGIISAVPGSLKDTVYINSDIALEFNESMKIENVYDAFSMNPKGEGKFVWENENKKLRFIPDKLLTPGTKYRVIISNEAKNNYGIPLEKNYEFEFTTNKRGRLQLVNNYPGVNQKDISTSTKLKLIFNYPVELNVLSKNISLFSTGGNEIPLLIYSTNKTDEKFIVSFEPVEILKNDTEYNLLLSKEIKDELDIPLLNDIKINFSTELANTFNGEVVENFEDIKDWIKIDSNSTSKGIETGNTLFEKSAEEKISGKFSGRVSYKFNTNNGYLVLNRAKSIDLFNNGGEAGLWIFGDLSNNLFTVNLVNSEAETFNLVVDTLNWSGWKFKKFNLSIFASSDISLNSIVIKHNSKAQAEGEIYIDELQISKVSELTKTEENVPSEFSLEQNYPNPFNPNTTISFKIPSQSVVSLEVLNILGQKVRSLIHKENYAAGTWSVEWDGKSDYGEFMPSGVYLYKIRTAEFTEVKKMILIK